MTGITEFQEDIVKENRDLKPISEWTKEDCDSKEYWKKMFELGRGIMLSALDNHFYPDWDKSGFMDWVEGNKIVANKMLCDMVKNGYLQGYIDNSGLNLIHAKPIWMQKPNEPKPLSKEEQKRMDDMWKLFNENQKKFDH